MKLRTPFRAFLIAATGACCLLSMGTAKAEIRTGFASINEIANPDLTSLALDWRFFAWDVSRGPYYSSSYSVDSLPIIFSPPSIPYSSAMARLEIDGMGSFSLYNVFNFGGSVVQAFTAPLNLNELVDANQTFSIGNGPGIGNGAGIAGGEIKRFGYYVIVPEAPTPLYGWVELDGSASTIGNLVVNGTWAYDTTGAPITVGTVPEPTTLMLVGLGCLVLFAHCRFGRKQS